jgi:hypothetical protein
MGGEAVLGREEDGEAGPVARPGLGTSSLRGLTELCALD